MPTWNGLAPFDRSAAPILRHLTDEGFLDGDGGLLFVGPEAERRFGRRHFIELTASFTAPPQFTVLSGRTEIGRTDPSVLTDERPNPRRLLLGGRSWQVTYIDWMRKRVFVEPADGGGVAKWMGGGIAGLSYALTRAGHTFAPTGFLAYQPLPPRRSRKAPPRASAAC